MKRRTLGYYQQHPRQFEADRAWADERALERYLNEQDELAAEVEAREARDLPRVHVDPADFGPVAAPSKKQASQTPENEEAA